jgi:hypothetical protein
MEDEMGLFGRKVVAAKPAQDPAKPHVYVAPDAPPSSGHVACRICGLAPDDFVHETAKATGDEGMHWA